MRYCTDLKNKVYFETKGGNIEEVYLQFQEEVKKGTGFLFIVMKGRFSEGINFTGVLCRCLIVVGIPFLPLKDPGVM
jgi:Rad3-related DNA helicase